MISSDSQHANLSSDNSGLGSKIRSRQARMISSGISWAWTCPSGASGTRIHLRNSMKPSLMTCDDMNDDIPLVEVNISYCDTQAGKKVTKLPQAAVLMVTVTPTLIDSQISSSEKAGNVMQIDRIGPTDYDKPSVDTFWEPAVNGTMQFLKAGGDCYLPESSIQQKGST
ncbi:hypothetical protein PCANC_22814 [Puccinia coronata f. sp. avenae]|uniref:Uncharacterized protein n=1 Tax=Puccinia coronata f. sp. avenae TaxID=200324 RepID=A0A2N5UDE8_9BASI|nr:hypothetical protein PCANC_22814 [Puccinia coronata f. sp. avenae]PLW35764.1 hypothetical protein PCASD_20644 [Puccinia coronata f. sp. avenae]